MSKLKVEDVIIHDEEYYGVVYLHPTDDSSAHTVRGNIEAYSDPTKVCAYDIQSDTLPEITLDMIDVKALNRELSENFDWNSYIMALEFKNEDRYDESWDG